MMKMGWFCNMIHRVKPIMMMIAVQTGMAGLNVFYKLAADDGMSMRIMVAYRLIFAAATVVPLALYFERNSRAKLTWITVFQAFLCALFGGSLSQNLYSQSIVMTSATFASATANLIPVLTFIMAVLFRMERFELVSNAGRAKVFGTLICIGGALVLTLYKGVEIKSLSTRVGHLHNNNNYRAHQKSTDRILGPIFAILSSFSTAFSLIVQAKMSERYPYHYSSTALLCLMGSLQAVLCALVVEKNRWEEWKLDWDIRLLSVAYAGIVSSGIMVIFTMWCLRMRGPLFVSVFSPLALVLVAIADFLFLDENLHLGSVVGAFVIVFGLYTVVWGKSEEMKRITHLMPPSEKTDQQLEMIAEIDKNTKSCNMMARGVAHNFLPTLEIDALNCDPEDHLEEGDIDSQLEDPEMKEIPLQMLNGILLQESLKGEDDKWAG